MMGWSSITLLFFFAAMATSSIGNVHGDSSTLGFDEIDKSFEQSFVNHLLESGAFDQQEKNDLKDISTRLLKLIQKISNIRTLKNPSEERALMIFFASEISSIIVDNTKTVMSAHQQSEAVTNALRQAYEEQGEPPNEKFISEVEFLITIFLDFETSSSSSDSSTEENTTTPALPATKPENPPTAPGNSFGPPMSPVVGQENPFGLPGNPFGGPENPFGQTNNPFGEPVNPFENLENPSVTPTNSFVTPKMSTTTTENPLLTQKSSLTTTKKPLATTKKNLVTSGNSFATPVTPKVTPATPMITPEKHEITPMITPATPMKTPEKHEVTPMITPATPMITPEKHERTPKKPTETPEKLSVTPEKSTVTPGKSLVTPTIIPPIAMKPPAPQKPRLSELAGLANALDAVLLNSNIYTPQIIYAIQRSKGPGTLNFKYLVQQLSPIFSNMLADHNTLSNAETFIQFLVQTLISSLEIIRATDLNCLQVPTNRGPILSYIEALNEIAF